jgi:hypothetical protein
MFPKVERKCQPSSCSGRLAVVTSPTCSDNSDTCAACFQVGTNNNYKHEHTVVFTNEKTIEVTFSCLPMIIPSMPRPTPIDAYPTETSNLQGETEKILQSQVPFDGSGSSSDGYILDKKAHLELLVRNLVQGFPARYMSQDAS